MQIDIKALQRRWQINNIDSLYCADRQQACEAMLQEIPVSATVGISGSVTLDQLGMVALLEKRGNTVFNQYKPGLSREESLRIRHDGANADVFLTSANALSETGELVFFSGYGNRTAGIAYARKVLVVCGINKIAPALEVAMQRAREFATPRNCKRLNWPSACLADGICYADACHTPEFKRMCCQVLIIEAEVMPDRLKVVLVNEDLGF
ncbi:MAG: lactate utilization protein [Candidatus Omnitrophica bacterium]|nr:lactate utilization protein [Candidatus Omnitrophota bacterium]